MNLQLIFTQEEIDDSFRRLGSKKFKVKFSDLKRFAEKKKLSSLGGYLNKTNPSHFYNKELKRFSFSPYSGLKIVKPNGKYRPLLIPSPKDRIVLSAAFPKVRAILKQELEKFNALGLGLNREKKDEEVIEFKRTLKEIQTDLNNGMGYVLKLDFKDFFSTIDRGALLKKLSSNFKGRSQRRLFKFIKASIKNEIDADTDFHDTFGYLKLGVRGIPQGLSYSPLLASFYSLSLDKVIRKISNCKSFRYLDDMVILAESETKALEAYEVVKGTSKVMGLDLHDLAKEGESKTQMFNIKERKRFEFLGIEISKDDFFIPRKAIEDFKDTFRREVVNNGVIERFSFREVAKVYRAFATGWQNHYKSI